MHFRLPDYVADCPLNIRKLFLLVAVAAIPCAVFVHVRRSVAHKRYCIQQLNSLGFEVTLTRSPGTVFVLEDWYFHGRTEKVILLHSSEPLDGGLLESYFSKSLYVSAGDQEVGPGSLAHLHELRECNLDLCFHECDFPEIPILPSNVQSCILEESHDEGDVLRLLDGLANSEVRFLSMTLHWSEPEAHVLATKLLKLRNLEVLDLTYGDTWYEIATDPPMLSCPKLRLAFVKAELLEEMRRIVDP